MAFCKERFSQTKFRRYDSTSLRAVTDRDIDSVFSFDSLVHEDVLEAYLSRIGKKLTTHGVEFLHHSNLGASQPGTAGQRASSTLAPLSRSTKAILGQGWSQVQWLGSV